MLPDPTSPTLSGLREVSAFIVALLVGGVGLTSCAEDTAEQVGSPSRAMEGSRSDARPVEPAEPANTPAQAEPARPEPKQPKPAKDKPARATDPEPPSVADPKDKPGTASPAADDCDARVVSRLKPCSDDPDPCKLNSGWEGDEYCLLPPAPGEGIQLHFGPRSYSDTAETDRYKIEPHAFLNESLLAHVPLDEDRFIGRVTVHTRPGMDHWISMQGPIDGAEGIYPDTGCGEGRLFGGGGFGGGHNLIYDNPPLGVPAPENADIVRKFPGKASSCMALAWINRTDKPQLREAWVNLYFVDEPKNATKVEGIGVVLGLGLALPPGEKATPTYESTFDGDGRIIQLYAHRLQWTPRAAVWLNDELIYDSRNWEAQVTFNYDSITTNPPIDPAGRDDGAVSGIVQFKAGDRLKFSCFIENTSDETLTIANEVESGEMCNLWGSTVGEGVLRRSP